MFPANAQANRRQPRSVEDLITKLRVMLDKRRPVSKDKVIDFHRVADRSHDATFEEEHQRLVKAVADYFFLSDEDVSYEDFHILKTCISDLRESVKAKKKAKRRRKEIVEKASDFIDTTSRIKIDGIKKLSKHQLEQAYMAVEQLEGEMEEQQGEEVDLPPEANLDNPDIDEIKTQKELALQGQLPFKKEKKLLSVLKMDLENALRARQSSTPRPCL